MKKRPTQQYLSLHTKSALAFVFLAIISVNLTTLAYYSRVRTQLRQDIRERLRDSVAIGALQINGDLHALLTDPEHEGNETYKDLKKVLQGIRDSGTDIRFVYTMRQNPEGEILFIVDAEESEEDISHLGDIYDDAGPLLKDTFLTMEEPIVEEEFYTDKWGTWLTGYAPFYGSDGRLEGIVGMDISASKVIEKEQQAFLSAVAILLLSVPLIAWVGWLLGKNLTNPLATLLTGVNQLASGDLDTRIEVKSADEIGVLATTFNDMAGRLKELVTNLEQQVAERTQALERRVSQTQAAVEVGKAVAAQHQLYELLNRTTQLISDRFGYYHVGVFLLDEYKEYALLRASNSAGGTRMLARGHKLKVGEVGIVGTVAGSGQARIALDVGEDSVYFNNPDLPLTRSEAALPIIAGGDTLGVLDIQSTEENAFEENDIPSLQVLSDQLAVALQNARLLTETQQALAAVRRAYVETSKEGWENLLKRITQTGFIGKQHGEVIPISTVNPKEVVVKASASGEIVLSADRSELAAPIQVRDHTIGVLRLEKTNKADEWTRDEVADMKRLTNQIGIALESARLYQETRHRAELERAVSTITKRIGTEPEVESILRVTAESLGIFLKDCDVSVKILSDGELSSQENAQSEN